MRLAAAFFGCFGSLRGLSRLPMVVFLSLEDRQLTPIRRKSPGADSPFRPPAFRRRVSEEPAPIAYRLPQFRERYRECPSCAGASLPASVSWPGLSGVVRRRSWALPWAVV